MGCAGRGLALPLAGSVMRWLGHVLFRPWAGTNVAFPAVG
jgi:hypothetical protein